MSKSTIRAIVGVIATIAAVVILMAAGQIVVFPLIAHYQHMFEQHLATER